MATKDIMGIAFERFLNVAKRVSDDVADEVEAVFRKGLESPLDAAEAIELLKMAAEKIKEGAKARGDVKTAQAIGDDVDRIAADIIDSVKNGSNGQMTRDHTVHLMDNYNGIKPAYVVPRPWFHEKEIPMKSGYVNTIDINLWEKNERLDIHIGQFKEKYGREPDPQELLDIMSSKLQLPGVSNGDQFNIEKLARSIAINGVRKPPIIDIDGTLLDGNRRVTACNYILNSDEFTPEEKERAKHIYVWQLFPDATDDDRRRIVVSLNFEDDLKEEWPHYVKAHKVYEEWQAWLSLEPVKPGPKRQLEMKKKLSSRYALGPDTTVVNRYLKMVPWAMDFEDYHKEEGKKDKYATKHVSSEYFQYFDELSKGSTPGGVAYCLNQDDTFKRLAFDLLYDGKFKNWNQIRELKKIFQHEDAKDCLRKAREATDIDHAKDLVDDAITIVKQKGADERTLGANTRIEAFVKWLEQLPVKAFRDDMKPENLQRLLDALTLVKEQAEKVLEGK